MCVVKEENSASSNINVNIEVVDDYDYNQPVSDSCNNLVKSEAEDEPNPFNLPILEPTTSDILDEEEMQDDSSCIQMPNLEPIFSGNEIDHPFQEENENDYSTSGLQLASNNNECLFTVIQLPPVPTIKEEFPQQFSDERLTPQQERWPGEFAPGIRLHPVLVFKFTEADSKTGEGVLKCYTFTVDTFNKYSVRYFCTYCSRLRHRTYVKAIGSEFLEDPLNLNHVCSPKLYEEEISKRISRQNSLIQPLALEADAVTLPRSFSIDEESHGASSSTQMPNLEPYFSGNELDFPVQETENNNSPPGLQLASINNEFLITVLEIPLASTIQEELPQQFSEDCLSPRQKEPQQDRWTGEFAPGSRVNPVLIFKFTETASETDKEVVKCFTFTYESFNKHCARYFCAFCSRLGHRTHIEAIGSEFLKNPLALNHVCSPKLYEEEIGKRIARQNSLNQPPATEAFTVSLRRNFTINLRPKRPALYFRAQHDNDQCWLFVGCSQRKIGNYECNGCFLRGIQRRIWVEDGMFCVNPLDLPHACDPLSWKIEGAKKKPKINKLTGIFEYLDETERPVDPYPVKLYDAILYYHQSSAQQVLYFRSFRENDFCWLFEKNSRKTCGGFSYHCCTQCKKKGVTTVIRVRDNKFCSDPVALSHVCEPLSWSEEMAKRTGEIYTEKGETAKSIEESRTFMEMEDNSGFEFTEEPTSEALEYVPQKRIKLENEC